MSLLRELLDLLEVRRGKSMAKRIRRHLEPGETVLDMGCGSLIAAAEIERLLGVKVFGLDVLDFRRRPLPMALYGARRAPFRDGSFDAVLICFVLHHCRDGGLGVLEEARRLARKKILILEDSYDTPFQRRSIRLLDRILNRLENPEIPVPCRFRPTAEWARLFEGMGLRVSVARPIRTTPILRTPQVLFVLEKSETND